MKKLSLTSFGYKILAIFLSMCTVFITYAVIFLVDEFNIVAVLFSILVTLVCIFATYLCFDHKIIISENVIIIRNITHRKINIDSIKSITVGNQAYGNFIVFETTSETFKVAGYSMLYDKNKQFLKTIDIVSIVKNHLKI